MDGLSVDHLARIVTAGGGVKVSASYGVDALARLATAAKSSGATLTITNAAGLGIDRLARIATAGKGHVTFE